MSQPSSLENNLYHKAFFVAARRGDETVKKSLKKYRLRNKYILRHPQNWRKTLAGSIRFHLREEISTQVVYLKAKIFLLSEKKCLICGGDPFFLSSELANAVVLSASSLFYDDDSNNSERDSTWKIGKEGVTYAHIYTHTRGDIKIFLEENF